MRKQGSVTVAFSLVFLVLFSFIISFFEMAAYTARASYHASAALLAVENYFAEYLNPLYEEYHIFARKVPSGTEVVAWTEDRIGEDVSYMTEKKKGEKSLLLRSGAEFRVTGVSVLPENNTHGFYKQAVTAMKYRGALEITELLKEFAGMTEQADSHLEMAAAKAATDSAYGLVDQKILHLISLVDGVDITKYEKFLGGKNVMFQKDAYVKYFCTNPQDAWKYFDRTQVYQAFLENYENPCATLEDLAARAETLAEEMEERKEKELLCRNKLAEAKGWLPLVSAEAEQLGESLSDAYREQTRLIQALGALVLKKDSKDEQAALQQQITSLGQTIADLGEQKAQSETRKKELETEIKELEKEQKELEKKKKEQEKTAKQLEKEENELIEQAETICGICSEAYDYVEEIRVELKAAKQVKATCETVLDAIRPVIGEEAAEEYRKELDAYRFYESMDGFDFDRMKQTLLDNKSRLWNLSQQLTGTDSESLRRAAEGLRMEKQVVRKYSFEGLKINYGEMSLAEDLYDGIESMVSDKVASGFLGFLTEEEISEKELDVSYLPSGFRYEEEGFDIFSLLGTDMSEIFTQLQNLLPEDVSPGTVAGKVADSLLFHSYLSTHFSDYLEENSTGALSYETEYLIAGKDTDKENLSSVAMRLCAIRTILHFVSLYTDSARKAPAEQAALAACGLIGLPALKSLVVFLLLFIWALEEAMIDTAAFLQGKKLSLYPGKEGGSLNFQDILLFSKGFVLEKAEKKVDAKGVAMGYREFLHLFLFMTPKEDKSYRALDLIQENLRESYETSFRVNQCVWEISYQVDGRDYCYAYE